MLNAIPVGNLIFLDHADFILQSPLGRLEYKICMVQENKAD